MHGRELVANGSSTHRHANPQVESGAGLLAPMTGKVMATSSFRGFGALLEGVLGAIGLDQLLARLGELALAVPHRGVEAAAGQQRLVPPRSAMTPLSSTRISSALTTVDRRWAMTSVVRPSRDALQRVLDLALGEAVERRGRLVEHQDRRPLQDRAGDGDALLLAARQFEPALADLRVVAHRQRADEAVDLRALRRLCAPRASLAPSRP